MQRRSFLKSFAALAAAAVAGPVMAKMSLTDQERLIAAMKTGKIENQSFFFDRPIVLDFDNLLIKNCKFTFDCPEKMHAAIWITGLNIEMHDCHIDCGPNGSRYGLEFGPKGVPKYGFNLN